MRRIDPSLLEKSKELRSGATEVEKLIWSKIRDRKLGGIKFRRQHPMGSYIVDFVSLEKKLVVELDGGQHTEDREYDRQRTRWIESRGFKVLRFWNSEVIENLQGVLEAIRINISA